MTTLIYIVSTSGDHEGDCILGAYTSLGKAKEAVMGASKALSNDVDFSWWRIDQCGVDGGESGKKVFFYYHYPNSNYHHNWFLCE